MLNFVRFLERDLVGFPMEDEQVQCEQEHDQGDEPDPGPDTDFHAYDSFGPAGATSARAYGTEGLSGRRRVAPAADVTGP